MAIVVVSQRQSNAQEISSTSRLSKKVKLLEVLYDQTIETSALLYNGIEYTPYSRHTEGFPYYLSESPITGSILYGNHLFNKVGLQYDILTNKVIIEHPFYSSSIQLIDENISEFKLGDKKFIHLVTDSAKANISSGYYQVLYDGNSQCLAKRKKTIVQKVKNGELEVKFNESAKLYIRKNDKYFLVTSKKSLKDLFVGQSTSVRQFLRKNKLNFRLDKENTIVKVAAYYDGLK